MTNQLLDRQLIFVTGKGGVGKTSVAAALAYLAASAGKRTLVCEMDAKGALAAALDVAPLEFAPRLRRANLDAMAMNTEDALREYLRLFVRVPLVGRIGPLARTFDFVADAAPGVKEILGVGKLAYEVRERHYDLVVVDAEASGHIVAQVAAPRVIGDLIQVGMVRDQTRWMLDILEDPDRTGVVVVTTPEEMPVVETIELLDRLAAETQRRTRRRSSPTACCRRCSTARSPRSSASLDSAEQLLVDAAGPGVRDVVLAAQLTEARRRRRRPATSSASATPLRPACRSSTCPSCSPGRPAGGSSHSSPRRSPRSWTWRDGCRTIVRERRSGVDAAERARRAAGQQGDGARLRLRRRRQDDDGGRARSGRGGRAGWPGARAHGRSGAPPGRRARVSARIGNVATRVPDDALRVDRHRATRRAVGGDARHQGGLGRADPPPRARRRDPRLGAHQPAVPEHHQPLRAQPRLPGDGAAPRGALVRAATTS